MPETRRRLKKPVALYTGVNGWDPCMKNSKILKPSQSTRRSIPYRLAEKPSGRRWSFILNVTRTATFLASKLDLLLKDFLKFLVRISNSHSLQQLVGILYALSSHSLHYSTWNFVSLTSKPPT